MADILDRLDKGNDKTKWIGVGVGFLTLLVGYLAYRHMSTGSSATAATSTPATTDTSTTTPGSVDPAQLDTMFQQQQVQYQNLVSLLQGITPPSASTGPSAPVETPGGPGGNSVLPVTSTPSQVLQGGGWWYGAGNETPIVDTGGTPSMIGNIFTWLSPGAYAVNPSVQRYVETTPGTFAPVTKGQILKPGTPQYTKA